MTILITDQPGTNTYLTALIKAYKSAGITVICGLHNFFYSNLIPDILHIQWPEKLYSWFPFSSMNEEEQYKAIKERLQWYKDNNANIVHTIHNIKPHVPENSGFEERIFKLIISYSDILVHHCNGSVNTLKTVYTESAGKFNIVCPHGDYLLDYSSIARDEARRKLGIPQNKFVLLNFGNQLKYKNENFIESVFNKLPLKNKYLLTAGNNRSGGYSKGLHLYNSIKRTIRMKLTYNNRKYHYKVVTPEELPVFINAADIFFLAHSGNNLNSGILPLAATYSKPVIFPNIGCFAEQMEGWIYETYRQGNEDGAVNAVKNLYMKLGNFNNSFDNTTWLSINSWDKHVQRILKAVQDKFKESNVY